MRGRSSLVLQSMCAVGLAIAASVAPPRSNAAPLSQREALRARIDLTRSEIVLPRSRPALPAEAARRDFVALASLVEAKLGRPIPAISMPQGLVTATTEDMEMRLDPVLGRVLVRDQRGVAGGSARDATPKELLSQAAELMSALGAESGEQRAQVRTLAGSDVVRGVAGARTTMLARKVFVERYVMGVPVYGDRVVFTFTLGGQLRKVLGQWSGIDYQASRLTSAISSDQMIEHALDALVARGTSAESAPSIRLGTQYLIGPGANGASTLRLAGYAVLPSAHPEDDQGGHDVELVGRLDFDLPED